MAIVYTDNQHYSDIASALRAKLGVQAQFKPEDMASAVVNIPTGGASDYIDPPIYPTPTVTLTVT